MLPEVVAHYSSNAQANEHILAILEARPVRAISIKEDACISFFVATDAQVERGAFPGVGFPTENSTRVSRSTVGASSRIPASKSSVLVWKASNMGNHP